MPRNECWASVGDCLRENDGAVMDWRTVVVRMYFDHVHSLRKSNQVQVGLVTQYEDGRGVVARCATITLWDFRIRSVDTIDTIKATGLDGFWFIIVSIAVLLNELVQRITGGDDGLTSGCVISMSTEFSILRCIRSRIG